MWQVAGAAAAAGLCLADVAAEASRAAQMVGTMGVALSVCTIPGQVTSDRLGPGKMELGLGIHGEPGAAVADLQPVDIVVSHVLKQILSTCNTAISCCHFNVRDICSTNKSPTYSQCVQNILALPPKRNHKLVQDM
eukprot:Gb_32839 [translate_table: standard]